MRKNDFIQYVKDGHFREMFITEMGWNNYRGVATLPPIMIDDICYQFTTIAERSGFQILTCEVDGIPGSSVCKRIDTQLRKSANDYISIYILRSTEHHLWIAPVRQAEKRDLVTIEYETADKADFLFAKIDSLTFGNSERTTIVDVKERVQGSFAVNSEKITKDFYASFQKEHKAFAKFITGIDDQIEEKKNRNKQWYTSVMLNRLMFCYFIQKKGFLDGDFDYLRHKLEWCQREKGEDRFFHTFYKGFLLQLFQDGLNSPSHHREFEQTYGRIPYLNGGLFDQHQIEQDYADIDIADEAFQNLFAFFDKWRWHLNTRISASGKDINPDVLGYIFEQYINDRAEMGAYYTKEDITEYIGRNCILPFLLDKINHRPGAMLRDSGDRYIFDAVKQGYSPNWRSRIPAHIACGLLAPSGQSPLVSASVPLDSVAGSPSLLTRRAHWNEKTPEPFALPTEIWRETIERLQRCEEIMGKIANGEITNVNDFITYNLDIRQYSQDLLATTDDHLLIRHFYKALQQVTILDPTCGSGAFLFAAMNILEPLYETCIERMQEFNHQNPNLFCTELEEINGRYRSNIQYFIYKSIILRNLYGVDIMQEATEIAKLRLFLKMVAVVEVDRRAPNLGLDPLPDIDFNIRCGNTLVGYATEEEAVAGSSADLFTQAEFRDKMEMELEKVSMAFDHFRTQQLADHGDLASVKAAKTELRDRLSTLTDLLDHQLFSASHYPDFTAWRTSHQPFHWIAEYYQIIHGNGGFDVIIGNPPYVEYTKRSKNTGKSVSEIYQLNGYKTIDCGNLYAFVEERAITISHGSSLLGQIIPISSVTNDKYQPLLRLFQANMLAWYSCYSNRPGKLFENVEQRLTIFIGRKESTKGNQYFASNYKHWTVVERENLFKLIHYCVNEWKDKILGLYKVGSDTELCIYNKLLRVTTVLANYKSTNNTGVYYHNAPTYFIRAMIKKPNQGKNMKDSSHYKLIPCSANFAHVICCVLNSSIYYWYYKNISNCRDYSEREINNFPIPTGISDLEEISNELAYSYEFNKSIKNRIYPSGLVYYEEYYPAKSKPIIDEIDKVLARHYGFTEEELDFIINYDIKYRMGDALNVEES